MGVKQGLAATMKSGIGGIKPTELVRAGQIFAETGLLSPQVHHAAFELLAVNRYGAFTGPVVTHSKFHPDTVALIDEAGSWTYRELDQQSSALVRGWQRRGLTSDSVFAVLARNHRGLLLSMYACGKLGARLVMMNTGFAGPQLADVSTREGVTAVISDSEFHDTIAALDPSLPRFLSWKDDDYQPREHIPTLDDILAGENTDAVPAPKKQRGFVLLTSGTTGTPKGAPREKPSPLSALQFLDRVPLRTNQRVMMAAPLFHGTGLSQFIIAQSLGATVVVQRRFKPEESLRALSEHDADALVLVPTMLQRIVDLPAEVHAKFPTPRLKIIFAAGSSLSPDLCKRTADQFGDVLYNLYGSTEVAVATVAKPDELRANPGTVGRPPITCHVRLYDEHGTEITTADTIGRIFVKSGLSFGGYTDGRHKEIIDGFLSSGDVGHFDADGLLYVDGRDDDMIVSGGENVFPLEVENLLAEREDVLEAAVIGVDDEEFGARLRAFIVTSPDATVTEEEIKAYVKKHLARYKVPRDVVFLDELPRNATGKLLRRTLIEDH